MLVVVGESYAPKGISLPFAVFIAVSAARRSTSSVGSALDTALSVGDGNLRSWIGDEWVVVSSGGGKI